MAPLKLQNERRDFSRAIGIPRVLSVAPLKRELGLVAGGTLGRGIPRVLSVAPLKRRQANNGSVHRRAYSTRPKRGPIEAKLAIAVNARESAVFHAS